MNIDWKICSRARLARDPRFDGKFFIGVVSTRIYCRPTCRSRTSHEVNVRYFASAAAAAEAGFRPCLRCRPESAPGTPAWTGTRTTVTRALRLIHEGGLATGVDDLAERLGVGSRHLRRLFVRHLGATPSAVAQTRRLQFAKKLIDETPLPMHQVAMAAGFGSVRRFNAAICKVYRRTPTELRSLCGRPTAARDNQYLFRLHFRPPYNWPRILEFLAARATPGVEVVESGVYRRSIRLHGRASAAGLPAPRSGSKHGYFEVSAGSDNTLIARIHGADPLLLFAVVERVRSMFDLDADWQIIASVLGADSLLASRVRTDRGLRVPGCWDGFELAIRAILGQQISVAAATTLAGRLVRAYGQRISPANGLSHLFPSPETLARANLEICLLPARANTIRSLARAVCDGRIRFEAAIETDELLARLRELPGIGEWTAQYIAMRALREPDAFPCGDLQLLRAVGVGSPRELELRSESWRPWRSYAAMLLWQSHAPERGQAGSRRGSKETSYAQKDWRIGLEKGLDVPALD
jgi:AraC family transcriptional regulator, regulatory protein of adaptative response / DNA-3-methyladenine glycosylase II